MVFDLMPHPLVHQTGAVQAARRQVENVTRLFRILLAVGAVALSGPAMACSVPARNEDPAAITQHVRDLIARSAAIIDAEVVTPTDGTRTARLRPIRVLRGPDLPLFLVGLTSYCDIAFRRAGERVRVVLSGGPDRYIASLQDNGMDFATPAGARHFHAMLDLLLGAPLPPGFVRPGGEEPPPA